MLILGNILNNNINLIGEEFERYMSYPINNPNDTKVNKEIKFFTSAGWKLYSMETYIDNYSRKTTTLHFMKLKEKKEKLSKKYI